MKKSASLMSMLSILALGGCSMGFVPTGLELPKPYLEDWSKPAITFDGKEQDSKSCGGSTRGPDFNTEQVNAARQQGDKNDFAPRGRLFHDWERCMLKKSYRYAGKCYDNEISRASPACGAP
jgi:hypothetical protein